MNLQFAQKAVVVRNGSLLMVRKSAEDPHNPGRWELPGGRMKSDETIDEHLCREIWEEVGLRVHPGRPLSIWSWTMSQGGQPVTVVAVARVCDVIDGTLSHHNRDIDDHLAESEWVPIDSVLDLDVMPSQQSVIKEIVAASA